ncbi:hypothetical protein CAI21_04125 [Alkalilimnicola ehrlichii]|uniref:AfsA-related hotdog domain-containing protein n=1 Tax=Alkalilimnicola ehrlichii TaxID=351052 RepID=UPI000E2F2E97|nr:AfsA-related hotdog domain-containing protein [Alkalilimnicola ehrlichii]RFA30706.1 hypothetical protein CAI21_04125 [Alkalilimnicola ehrlichii]
MMSAFAETPVVESGLDYVRTIPRNLVHKRRIDNVFVTSMQRLSALEFACGAYVPQANLYLNELRFHPNDVLLPLIEIGRQAGIACCHSYLNVAQGQHFVLGTMGVDTEPSLYELDWSECDYVDVHICVSDVRYNPDGSFKSGTAESTFYVDGRQIYRQFSHSAVLTKKRYRALRRGARQHTSNVAAIGAVPLANALEISTRPRLARSVLGERRWLGIDGRIAANLAIDLNNLFFFDHPNDHAPGMLLLEGMRQLAMEVAGGLPGVTAPYPKIQHLDLSFTHLPSWTGLSALWPKRLSPTTKRLSVRNDSN